MNTTDTSKKASPQDWHPADVKAALEKKGWSLRRFARAHDYSPSAANKALRLPFPGMEALIAAELGLPATAIWPSRYDENGEPKRGRPVANSTCPGRGRNVSRGAPQ